MALPQLTDEQIRTWSRSQKDQWWFKNVYRGDMAQLTLRSAFTGFLLGGILAATNLYIGGKTGITTGVGLTSVILAFALYRAFAKAGFAKDFTILENNCTQSIATAAGYMTSPLISALAAYMIVTGKIIPWWHMLAWMLVVAVLGVFLAFPMKRRFINEDQLPFPVFRDNEDRQSFLATLEPACRNTDWLAADPFLSRRAISNLEHLHLA